MVRESVTLFSDVLVWLVRDARAAPPIVASSCNPGILCSQNPSKPARASATSPCRNSLVFRLALAVIDPLRAMILNKIAIRITRAKPERTVPADAFQSSRLSALFAGLPFSFPVGMPSLYEIHFVAGLPNRPQTFPSSRTAVAPTQLAFLDLVQFSSSAP